MPKIESPRILPTSGSGRPSTADTAPFIAWALALPEVGGEPTDHPHGPWARVDVHHERLVWAVCPTSCTRPPVRWLRP
jgi:hypothetical protein